MPSVTKHAIVCPIRSKGTDGRNGNVVYQEHHGRKNGKGRKAVGDHPVDFVGNRKLSRRFFLITALENLTDINIAFVGDDRFRIVLHFIFHSLDIGLYVV